MAIRSSKAIVNIEFLSGFFIFTLAVIYVSVSVINTLPKYSEQASDNNRKMEAWSATEKISDLLGEGGAISNEDAIAALSNCTKGFEDPNENFNETIVFSRASDWESRGVLEKTGFGGNSLQLCTLKGNLPEWMYRRKIIANNTENGAEICDNNIFSGTTPQEYTQFSYKRNITINNAENANRLSNYTVSLALNAGNFDFSKTLSGGNDTRFTWLNATSNSEQNASFWIEKWDSAAKNALIWIKIPDVAANKNETVYMYYGNTTPVIGLSNKSSMFIASDSDMTHTANAGGTVSDTLFGHRIIADNDAGAAAYYAAALPENYESNTTIKITSAVNGWAGGAHIFNDIANSMDSELVAAGKIKISAVFAVLGGTRYSKIYYVPPSGALTELASGSFSDNTEYMVGIAKNSANYIIVIRDNMNVLIQGTVPISSVRNNAQPDYYVQGVPWSTNSQGWSNTANTTIRKYTTPEPNAIAGAERQAEPPHCNALMNYPVRINLASDSFDFSKAHSNGNDIMFTWINTTSNSEQNASFWIEKWDSVSKSALIWVKVPRIAQYSNETLYMYYGNPAANSLSNGSATFTFFSGFDSASLDPEWNVEADEKQCHSSGVSTNTPDNSLYSASIYVKGIYGGSTDCSVTNLPNSPEKWYKVYKNISLPNIDLYLEYFAKNVAVQSGSHYSEPFRSYIYNGTYNITEWCRESTCNWEKRAINLSTYKSKNISVGFFGASGNGNIDHAINMSFDAVKIRKYLSLEPNTILKSEEDRSGKVVCAGLNQNAQINGSYTLNTITSSRNISDVTVYFDKTEGTPVDFLTAHTPVCGEGAANHAGADWIVTDNDAYDTNSAVGTIDINGTHCNINKFEISAGTIAYVKSYDGANGNTGRIEIYAVNATISGTLDASGSGYKGGKGKDTADVQDGFGPGKGSGGTACGGLSQCDGGGGGGAGYGAAGNNGANSGNNAAGGAGGSAYDTAKEYGIFMGSGGGAGGAGKNPITIAGSDGGNGGGAILILAKNNLSLTGSGNVFSNGYRGSLSTGYGGNGGAGSGGGILLAGRDVEISGNVNASSYQDVSILQGRGGGGRIKIFYQNSLNNATAQVQASGFNAGTIHYESVKDKSISAANATVEISADGGASWMHADSGKTYTSGAGIGKDRLLKFRILFDSIDPEKSAKISNFRFNYEINTLYRRYAELKSALDIRKNRAYYITLSEYPVVVMDNSSGQYPGGKINIAGNEVLFEVRKQGAYYNETRIDGGAWVDASSGVVINGAAYFIDNIDPEGKLVILKKELAKCGQSVPLGVSTSRFRKFGMHDGYISVIELIFW